MLCIGLAEETRTDRTYSRASGGMFIERNQALRALDEEKRPRENVHSDGESSAHPCSQLASGLFV